MYSFRHIRNAILAGSRPAGFPFDTELSPSRLVELRAVPHLQHMLEEVRTATRGAQDTPITSLPFSAFKLFVETGSRREYERAYFNRRMRLLALALMAIIDESDELLSALEDLIWAICDEYSWCLPAHLGVNAHSLYEGRLPPEQIVDLFAAETAHALAEAVTLLNKRLNPWIAERVRAEIDRRFFRPLFHDPVHFHWESLPMNWSSVCAGAAGMAALLLVDDAERLAGMIERCCRAMECFMEGFAPDGGCAEGIGYWQYGFGYYVYFADMLYLYTNGALDLFKGELVAEVAAFPAGVNLGGTAFVNYSDGESRVQMHPGLLSRLKQRLNIRLPEVNHPPSLHNDHAYRWPHVTRDLLWTDPGVFGHRLADGTGFFADLQWVVDRRRSGDVPIAFSARGGNNGEPHNQNDLGHFIIQIGNESLLADLGAGLYTRDYFGALRYDHIHNSSAGHSVPIIDGLTQSPGSQFRAELLRYEPHAHGVTFAIDMTRAYTVDQLVNLRRLFEWTFNEQNSTAQLVITDDFTFTHAPTSIDEVFISLHHPTIADDRITWQGEQGSVRLTFDPSLYTANLESIASQNHHAEPITVHRLRLNARILLPTMMCRWTFACEAKH